MRGRKRGRSLTIVAQDPMLRGKDGRILRGRVSVPNERLAPGPAGYRATVIDYDATRQRMIAPQKRWEKERDPFEKADDEEILFDAAFHAQNVYAVTMCTLSRMEFALGRRVSWSFDSHQIKLAPHAFLDANAFYSERDEALLFGYFPGSDGSTVQSCL